MRKRKVGSWVAAAAVVVGSLSFSVPAGAEGGLTLEERLERLERKGEQPAGCCDTSELQRRLDQIEAHIKNLPVGIKLGGGIATSYKYDLNDPDSDRISLRSFDQDHNSFTLDLFQLQVSRAPGEDGVGFLTKVDFGKLAERLGTDWDGDGTSGNVAEEQNSVDLQEAYITYNFPGLPDLQIKAGKFATPIGAEVIEPWNNPNVSRSLTFSWGNPFTHASAASPSRAPHTAATPASASFRFAPDSVSACARAVARSFSASTLKAPVTGCDHGLSAAGSFAAQATEGLSDPYPKAMAIKRAIDARRAAHT